MDIIKATVIGVIVVWVLNLMIPHFSHGTPNDLFLWLESVGVVALIIAFKYKEISHSGQDNHSTENHQKGMMFDIKYIFTVIGGSGFIFILLTSSGQIANVFTNWVGRQFNSSSPIITNHIKSGTQAPAQQKTGQEKAH